jgi:hypothetical protein
MPSGATYAAENAGDPSSAGRKDTADVVLVKFDPGWKVSTAIEGTRTSVGKSTTVSQMGVLYFGMALKTRYAVTKKKQARALTMFAR